jgi:hypothetical protein
MRAPPSAKVAKKALTFYQDKYSGKKEFIAV